MSSNDRTLISYFSVRNYCLISPPSLFILGSLLLFRRPVSGMTECFCCCCCCCRCCCCCVGFFLCVCVCMCVYVCAGLCCCLFWFFFHLFVCLLLLLFCGEGPQFKVVLLIERVLYVHIAAESVTNLCFSDVEHGVKLRNSEGHCAKKKIWKSSELICNNRNKKKHCFLSLKGIARIKCDPNVDKRWRSSKGNNSEHRNEPKELWHRQKGTSMRLGQLMGL